MRGVQLLLLWLSFVGVTRGQLLISEYIDPSTTRAGLELWNVSGTNITFGTGPGQLDARIEIYANGSVAPTTTMSLTAGATVLTGAVFVVAHPQSTFQQLANQVSTAITWTGNDAIVVRIGSGTIMDSLGQVGFDPITEWGTGDVSTADNTLRRKIGNTVADTNPSDAYNPAAYFDGFPINNVEDLGMAPVPNMLPYVATVPSPAVSTNEATLYGEVDSRKSRTQMWFEWGLSTNYGNTTPLQTAGSGIHGFLYGATGLNEGATYHYRAVASNGLGTVYGTNVSFITSNRAPVVATLAPTNVAGGYAWLNGTVNPNRSITMAWFEWGTSTNYGNVSSAAFYGGASSDIHLTRQIEGLLSLGTYHYRIVASNSFGISYGANVPFGMPYVAPPTVTTLTPGSVAIDRAMLRLDYNPNGSMTWAWFEYGTTTNYGTLSNGRFGSSGTNGGIASSTVVNLEPLTTYHYRAVGSNAGGVVYGSNVSFTTEPRISPGVTTLPPTVISQFARLNGNVNPRGTPSAAWFEWGTTTNFGSLTAVTNFAGTTNSTNFSAPLAGLAGDTTYYYRAAASNVAGIVYGTNVSFHIAAGIVGLDSEPNNTFETATPLFGTNIHLTARIYPEGDRDFYSFAAHAGDRVYASVVTAFSMTGNDSRMSILASDGVTERESDDNNGNFDTLTPSIAGATIPATGTYYVMVDEKSGTGTLRPYSLWLRLARGTPSLEVEPNNNGEEALPASGWVSGALSSASDVDEFTLHVNAGETIFASLDLDPDRDGTEWDGTVAIGSFAGQMVLQDDPGTTGPDSEAMVITVKNTGTYTVRVASSGAGFGNYHLSVSVLPKPAGISSTYSSADTPMPLVDAGRVTSTITVPDSRRVGKVQVYLNLSHTNVPDLDLTLTAPDGNTVGLFTDMTSNLGLEQPAINLGLDDDAALPISAFRVRSGMIYQPENRFRLAWFKGQQAQGPWTLTIHDDATNNSGVLNNWQLVISDELAPAGQPLLLYSSSFETNDGGFTHSGVQDEWQRGTPASVPITNCASGVMCWKTDLATNYNSFATNDLFSPTIDLAGLSPSTYVVLSWAMKYQFEGANFERARVDVEEVGGSRGRTVWAWEDNIMSDVQGPNLPMQESAGWGLHRALINDFVGRKIRVRFHFRSEGSVELSGWAIDDVSVAAYPPVTKAGNSYEVNLLATPHQQMSIQYSTNLGAATWWDLNPPLLLTTPSSGIFGYTDTNASAPQRFYRGAVK